MNILINILCFLIRVFMICIFFTNISNLQSWVLELQRVVSDMKESCFYQFKLSLGDFSSFVFALNQIYFVYMLEGPTQMNMFWKGKFISWYFNNINSKLNYIFTEQHNLVRVKAAIPPYFLRIRSAK